MCSPQTLRLSRLRFVRTHSGAAVPVADSVEEPDAPVVPLSSAQSRRMRDRDTCRAAHSRNGRSAIETLKLFLSSEDVASDHLLIYSPAILRSLYYRAESRNQLGMLDSKMLSILIGLFGSLSIDPCTAVVYREPLASRFLEVPTGKAHWAFVLKVGKHKLQRGTSFQDSDRFWLMRAELAVVQAGRPLERKLLFP